MNVTLSIDDRLVETARELARKRGTSLNQLIRDFLEELASASNPATDAGTLERLWKEGEGDSRGWRWNRDALHDRPLLP